MINCQTVSDKLSWSHICELIKFDDDLERSFYEQQTVNENWSVRELQRQIDSVLFFKIIPLNFLCAAHIIIRKGS